MDTFKAFNKGEEARRQGRKQMVFDWDKAAHLISVTKPKVAGAGLESDWEYTGGVIFENGEIVRDSYTYLSSNWATPELDMDGDRVPCWKYEEDTDWDAGTKWPESSVNILLSLLPTS